MKYVKILEGVYLLPQLVRLPVESPQRLAEGRRYLQIGCTRPPPGYKVLAVPHTAALGWCYSAVLEAGIATSRLGKSHLAQMIDSVHETRSFQSTAWWLARDSRHVLDLQEIPPLGSGIGWPGMIARCGTTKLSPRPRGWCSPRRKRQEWSVVVWWPLLLPVLQEWEVHKCGRAFLRIGWVPGWLPPSVWTSRVQSIGSKPY